MKILRSLAAVLLIAFIVFAANVAANGIVSDTTAAASTIQTPASPVLSTPSNTDVYTSACFNEAAEVDIGNFAVAARTDKRTVAVTRSLAPTPAEYVLEVRDVDIGPPALTNQRAKSGGFTGLGHDHYARADV